MTSAVFAFTLLISLSILLPIPTHSRLLIKRPDILKAEFDAYNGLEYSVVTPKDTPNKKNFIGTLVLSNPITGCGGISSIYNEVFDVPNPIIVMQHGDCAYPQKAKTAEMAGAKMVLIVSDHNMEPNHQIEREYQYPVGIETIIVAKNDGEKLIDYLQRVKQSPEDYDRAEISYSSEVDRHINYIRKTQDVVLDYWFSSADFSGDSYRVLELLKDVLTEFGSSITFNPHYVHWQCDTCQAQSFSKADYRCLSGGRYCDPEFFRTGMAIRGTDAVKESLKLICLRNIDKKVTLEGYWWTYVRRLMKYAETCGNILQQTADQCLEATKMITDESLLPDNVRDQVDQCVEDSFENANGSFDEMVSDNMLLSQELDLQNQIVLPHYPSIYVNERRYTNSFTSRGALKDFICSHFDNAPETCQQSALYNVAPTTTEPGHFWVYFFMGIGCCLFMAVLVYCVRRSVKRQVMMEMDTEVSSIISYYTQIGEQAKMSGAQV